MAHLPYQHLHTQSKVADLVEQDGQYLQGPQDLEKLETLDLSPITLMQVIISSIVHELRIVRQSTPDMSQCSAMSVADMETYQVVKIRKKKITIHISVRR